jgi:tRNA nucleotidyltransferase (CCA-adding enzyme)
MGEWSKLLVKGREISRGLNFLKDVGWLKYYPELKALVGCRQDREWHPEGDVWAHTLCCLDAFARRRDAGDFGDQENLIVGLAVLCHDFGKPAATFYDRERGRIRSPGHDEAGVEPTLSFLRRLTNEERILKEVPPLVRLHMRPYSLWKQRAGENAVRRLAAEVVRIDRLIRVAEADDEGRPPFPSEREPLEWLASESERLKVADSAPKPLVLGRDLIALGLKPSVRFGVILKACYEAQLDGKIATHEEGVEFVRLLASEENGQEGA